MRGIPSNTFAETINSVIDHFPNYRGFVAAAWQTLKKWEEAEPVERSMVMPAALFTSCRQFVSSLVMAENGSSLASGVSWSSTAKRNLAFEAVRLGAASRCSFR